MLPNPNQGKNLEINVNEAVVKRYPIKTPLIQKGDDLVKIVAGILSPILPLIQESNKTIVIGEKAVAASQGRAIPIIDIKPSGLAKFLSRYVTKTTAGIGLGMPETMEMAIRELGYFRILSAFFIAAVTKPLGIKGMFYRVAGPKARAIDGPTSGTLPPYNSMTVLSPENPDKVAAELSSAIGGLGVLIIDANDIGQNVLGSSNVQDPQFIKESFRDNPLGQGHEQTPVAIVAW